MSISIPEIKLNDGMTVPAVGFGTYKLNGAAGVQAIVSAIDAGYRLIDLAFNYENEGAVGEAVGALPFRVNSCASLRNSRVGTMLIKKRSDHSGIIVQVGLDYFDLYLIHWPNPSKDLYVEAWQALVDAQKWGLVRSIGVSNFLPEHLQRIIKETGVAPSINQVELHPYFAQEEQRAWHEEHGIVTESWSPLGRANHLLEDPAIQKIAAAIRNPFRK